MLVECERCPARDRACAECVVGALRALALLLMAVRGALLALAPPGPGDVCLDAAEQAAVEAFVRAGLVSEADAEGFVAVRTAAAMAG